MAKRSENHEIWKKSKEICWFVEDKNGNFICDWDAILCRWNT